MNYTNGNVYTGQWINGFKHGKGLERFSNDSELVYYDGFWKNNSACDEGTLLWRNGEVYKGHFENGRRHGFGPQMYANTSMLLSYEGDWEKNKRTGNGKLIYKDKRTYIGDWNEDEFSGNGTFNWNNREEYIGEWSNNRRNGFGRLTFKANDPAQKYVGDWKDDAMEGNGTIILYLKTKIGMWVSGSTVVFMVMALSFQAMDQSIKESGKITRKMVTDLTYSKLRALSRDTKENGKKIK